MLSRQEVNTMRHLANAQYWDRPAGGNTGRLFLAFGGPVCADRFSNCPLDRVLTYKNLIYLLNLQFNSFASSLFTILWFISQEWHHSYLLLPLFPGCKSREYALVAYWLWMASSCSLFSTFIFSNSCHVFWK